MTVSAAIPQFSRLLAGHSAAPSGGNIQRSGGEQATRTLVCRSYTCLANRLGCLLPMLSGNKDYKLSRDDDNDEGMEPRVRVELTTARLRIGSSPIELPRPVVVPVVVSLPTNSV